jgi:hypothetical protein
MTTPLVESSPSTRGRILAVLYLVVITGGIIGQAIIADRLIDYGDASLKPVNRSLARLTMVLGLTGCGIKTMARLFFYAPLILLGGSAGLAAIEPAQLEALSLAFIRINSQGAAIGLIFFGFETLLRGWLIYQSGFLPRFLGVMSMIGGLGWLTYLWPPLGAQVFMFVALFALVGVIATSGWLLMRGVDDVKWRARAALAASSIWR